LPLEARCRLSASSHQPDEVSDHMISTLRFVVSHLFARKKAKGWGLEMAHKQAVQKPETELGSILKAFATAVTGRATKRRPHQLRRPDINRQPPRIVQHGLLVGQLNPERLARSFRSICASASSSGQGDVVQVGPDGGAHPGCSKTYSSAQRGSTPMFRVGFPPGVEMDPTRGSAALKTTGWPATPPALKNENSRSVRCSRCIWAQ